jgi:hypothetical protein
MPNTFKYNVSAETLALKSGNFWIGTNDVGKGLTDVTGYWHGITPPRGGYTIYLNKETNGPSIIIVANDDELVTITNRIAGASYTTAAQCLSWFITQSDKMVLNRDYEAAATNSLIFNLDAGFTPSYPTSNTTWYDVSPQGNNGTFINGPTYSSTGGGSIVFDGVDDTISIPSNSLLNTPDGFTSEIWVKFNNSSAAVVIHKDFVYTIRRANSTTLQWADGTNWSYANWGSTSPSFTYDTSNTNRYYHIAVTKSGNVVTVYLDGTSKVQKTFGNNGVGGNTNPLYIGSYASGNRFLNGNVSAARIYNRALTSTEILQNFRYSGPQAFSSCKTCKEIIDTFPQLAGYDGLYWVYPGGPTSSPYQVYCDMTTDGGGWMLVARSHPTTVKYNGKNWGWKGGSIGSINDFSQAYQLGWGEIWDTTGSTFTSYIYGNQRTNFDNSWGPFVYKVSSIDYPTFFGSDTQQTYTRSTLKSNTSVYGTTVYPSMQNAIGFTTTGTNNNNYYMRDCCGYFSYGGGPTKITTTYCGRTTSYSSGPWCGGSTNTGGIYDYGTYITSGYTYGGTDQYMIMVK